MASHYVIRVKDPGGEPDTYLSPRRLQGKSRHTGYMQREETSLDDAEVFTHKGAAKAAANAADYGDAEIVPVKVTLA